MEETSSPDLSAGNNARVAYQRLQQQAAAPGLNLAQTQALLAEALAQQAALWQENQELHAAQQELAASTARLQAAEAVAHIGSYELDLASGAFHFSAGLFRLLNEEPGSFTPSLAWLDARSHPDDVLAVQRTLEQAIAHKQPYQYTRRIRWPNGQWRLLKSHGRVVCNAAGAAVRLEGVVEDHTGQQQATQALQASEEQFRLFVTVSSDMVYKMSPDWHQMYFLVGKEFLTDTLSSSASWLHTYIPVEEQAQVQAVIDQAIQTKSLFEHEHPVIQADGSVGWVHSRAVPVLDAHGHLVEWVGAASDITTRKQAEQEALHLKDEVAQYAEDKYRTLFNTIDEGFCLVELLYDAQGTAVDYRFLEVNQAFERQTGVRDVLGKIRSEIPIKSETYWLETYAQVVRTGQPMRYENYHADTARWYEGYVARMGGAGSRQVCSVFSDVTTRKQAEATLQERAKRKSFLLQLSDVLSPLADAVAIQAAATLVAQQFFQADRCYYGEIIHGKCLIRRDARHAGLPSVAGEYDLDQLPLFSATLRAGQPIVVEDVQTTPLVDESLRQLCIQLQVISFINVPVIKNDQPVGVLCVVHSTPRHWTPLEINLVQETSERAWAAVERARIEEQLFTLNRQLEQLVAERTHELRESRDLLQSVFDTSLLAVSVLHAVRNEAGEIQDFRIAIVNKELVRAIGRTDLVGKLYAQEYPGIRQTGLFDLLVQAVETGQPQGMEYYYGHEGFDHWFSCQFVKMDDGVVATNLDITERKLAEQELLKNLRLLEQSEQVAQLGSWMLELATGELRWSAGMYRLFHLEPGTPVRPTVYLNYATAADRPVAERVVQALTTTPTDFEEILRLQVGHEERTMHLKAVLVRDVTGQPVRLLGVDLDISRVQRLEADNLQLRLQQQKALFEAVQAAQEAERKRIAEGLHNGVGQLLYATKLSLDYLKGSAAGNTASLPPAQREANRLLSEAIRQTRVLSHELVPMVLEEFGLPAALQDLCQKIPDPQLRFVCRVQLDPTLPPLPASLQLALYRMAQEMVQNIVKHAHGATEASLELEGTPGFVLLRAEDNGPGFATNALQYNGLGLRSIRDRVSLLGGTLAIGSNAGAYVRLRVPVPTAA
ncbi:PAS domain-containing protein [Hymenobacter aerilatus]|uniref:histidine kinase n=1 Tax=Hymenobacter aerilatus TaxID=2932251 RepID=A0A8T9T019_9BACT|nr:PAS domain-containing protein [Hymenobacter aerilatus]UOR06534.1 PAS domain-containing protein [Hymenobacter aerilatus]